ncbi:MAG TPA: M56 family metallopeptidase, partial [Candidatus Sulfotelmatobacter sp.]|nr:M56 family metallopeptidase [Candidatus Sulfotelmatobacter sp.]
MTVLTLQTLSQVFVERLLNTAVEGVVLAGFVWLLFRFFGRQDSGTRFVAWFSALLAIVALPFFSESSLVASHPALPSGLQRGITLPTSWAGYFFSIWIVVASLMLFRLGFGLWRVRQLRSVFIDVDLASLDPEISAIVRNFSASHRTKLCVSIDLAVPAAVGFFRPAIVLPANLLPQLSPEEMKLILLHEFAHFRRWDNWTNLVQKIVKAVFFFHPAVWWIENRLTLEREMACDDIVLAQTEGPRAYATSLISFAEKLQNARTLALAQNLVSRMCHMSLRVTQILDGQRPKRTRLWKPVLGLSAGLFALALGTASYAPRFIAFENHPPASQNIAVSNTAVADAKPVGAKFVGARFNGPVVAAQMRTGAPQARVVPASFTMRTAGVSPQAKPTSRCRPVAIKARATRREFVRPETVVILETTQYDASGSGVWTLCIWKVGGSNL